MRTSWGIRDILLLIAVICFVLSAIGLDFNLDLTALGLAFGFGAFLVGDRGLNVR
jgi:hypothetical protein